MTKILKWAGIGVLCAAGAAFALDILVEDCYVSVTNSVTGSAQGGLVDSIVVEGNTLWTGTVTVATSWETLLTASAVTQTNKYRPRLQCHNTSGVVLGSATNAFEAIYLDTERVTVTVTSLGNITNDVRVRITTRR